MPMLERVRRGIGSLMPRRGLGGRGRRGFRHLAGVAPPARSAGRRGHGISGAAGLCPAVKRGGPLRPALWGGVDPGL
jgi:hypothetical protein